MRLNIEILTLFSLLLTATPAIAHPQPIADIQLASSQSIVERAENSFADVSDLGKRKGGGGGGGKGGSGSSGSSGKGGSSSSGSSSSGSSGSSSSGYVTPRSGCGGFDSSTRGGHSGRKPNLTTRSSSSSSAGKGSSTSSTGGSTKQGSGVQPSYGGGRYYGGGATTPYRSGLSSPLGLPAVFLAGSALAIYPGLWLYGAYGYNYHNPYTFRNHSATNSTDKSTRDLWINALVARQDTGVNETKPVTCLCAAYQECGCDDNGNTTFLDSLIGDGSYAALNKTLVNVADINGTSTIVLNGTLPNGTTIAGGSENANGAQRMLEASGYWVMIALVGCTVILV